MGDDAGCFESALSNVKRYGGVIEHPCDSHAWRAFNLPRPTRNGGWVGSVFDGYSCCVYQGHYGHLAGKPTWLYVFGIPYVMLPELKWGKCAQRLHPVALERHGYEKARRIGMMAMVGGKDKTKIRNATTPEFRDILISIANLVNLGEPWN
jgi:hypothetical protein